MVKDTDYKRLWRKEKEQNVRLQNQNQTLNDIVKLQQDRIKLLEKKEVGLTSK